MLSWYTSIKGNGLMRGFQSQNPKFLEAKARTQFFSSQNEDGVALSVAFNFLI